MAYASNGSRVFPYAFRVALQVCLGFLVVVRANGASGGLVAWGGITYYTPQGMPHLISADLHRGGEYVLRIDGTVLRWWQSMPVAGATNVSAIDVSYSHAVALKSDRTIIAWGVGASVPNDLSNTVAVAAGREFTVAVSASGNVRAWGYNFFGQCNVPSTLSNVVAIACGDYHTVALKQNGTLASWGFNHSQTTVVPSGLSNVVAITAGEHFSVAVKADGRVVAWGYNDIGQTSVPPGLTNVVAVASGDWHTLALKSDGTIVAWGYTNAGQTAVPAGLSNVFHVAAGAYGSVALTNDGSPSIAWCASNREVYTGATTVLGVGAVSPFPPRYQWYVDGNEIDDATNSTLRLTNLQLADAGEYTVVVTNLMGAVSSAPTRINVSAASPILRAGPLNTTSVLRATTSFSVSVEGSEPLSYQWWFNDIALANETNSTLVISNVQQVHAGNYRAFVTNSLGSVVTTNATLAVLPFRLMALARATSGFQMRVENVPENIRLLEIYASTNLIYWESILSMSSFFPFSRSFQYTDRAGTNSPQRFYRAECIPR